MISSSQVVINHNVFSSIIEFIESDKSISNIVIFTQSKIKKSEPDLLQNIQNKIKTDIIILDEGENSKELDRAMNSIENLISMGSDRNTLLISYGGGAVSDHVGFIASVFKRGIKYINIPTTLVGMIDASIGGKTAINMNKIKNQIGTFYHPSKVFIDLNFLDKMPKPLLSDGLGEMFKYAILSGNRMIDSFKAFLDSGDSDLLNNMINDCCNMKISIVQKDETDQGMRKTLNLGHTFGHAIESDSKNRISHGIAVIHGILMEAFLSWKKGILKESEFSIIADIGQRLISDKYIVKDVDKYVNIMLGDKKNISGEIGIITIKNIGAVQLEYFTFDEICGIVEEYNEYISN